MALYPKRTAYLDLKPATARIVIAALFLLAVASVLWSCLAKPTDFAAMGLERRKDADLYMAEAARVHAGEGYYEAAAKELRGRGYPTGSIFNWRSPLPVWVIGKMPRLWLGKVILGALALVVIFVSLFAIEGEQPCTRGFRVTHALLMTGPLSLYVADQLFVVPVLWAGALITLSISAFALRRPYVGVLLGILALFTRELALLYCVLSAALAWWQGRRLEFSAWIVGGVTWAIWYGWHILQVLSWMPADAWRLPFGWVQFGGLAFLVSTVKPNVYLLLAPTWISALYLVAAIMGIGGWSSPMGTRVRLTVGSYLLVFCIVGHEVNIYWGLLIGCLLCFGVARAPASARDLWRVARTNTQAQRTVNPSVPS